MADLGAEPVRGDLDDVEAMALGAEGASVAFHLAAHLGTWGDPEDFERGNVTGTKNALAAAERAGVARFVHVGTEASLMAGHPLVNVDETAPLRPDSKALYSATKARAEAAVLAANREGFATMSVRPRLCGGPATPRCSPTSRPWWMPESSPGSEAGATSRRSRTWTTWWRGSSGPPSADAAARRTS